MTPATEGHRDSLHAYMDTLPARRGAEPDEVAEVIRFLLSPRASYVHGTSVAVDGGRLAVQSVF